MFVRPTCVAFLAFVLAGCNMDAIGSKVIADPQTIASIVPGRSTKEDVQAAFGAPAQDNFADNGDETWTYVHMATGMTSAAFIPGAALFSAPVKNTTDNLTVRFDHSGIVKNIGRGTVSTSPNGLLN
jgi:outer membrane protein assembly factor BamE (lipoprotein component of BamABCDE complex)